MRFIGILELAAHHAYEFRTTSGMVRALSDCSPHRKKREKQASLESSLDCLFQEIRSGPDYEPQAALTSNYEIEH